MSKRGKEDVLSKNESTKSPGFLDGHKHCDDHIHDLSLPKCVRKFLLLHRLPATDQTLLDEEIEKTELYARLKPNPVLCHMENRWYRVVMASRLGDVGITTHLERKHGYDSRLFIDMLTDFTEKRPDAEEKGRTAY